MAITKIFLSLGSNLGDREGNLYNAVRALKKIISQIKVSQVYETEPMYSLDQPQFLNLAVSGYADCGCLPLLKKAQDIEKKLGRCRVRETHNGPRTLDIDILLYGDVIMDSDEITIPHPKMEERLFVLVPLLEIDPDLVSPSTARPFADSLRKLVRQGIYTYQSAEYNWESID